MAACDKSHSKDRKKAAFGKGRVRWRGPGCSQSPTGLMLARDGAFLELWCLIRHYCVPGRIRIFAFNIFLLKLQLCHLIAM